MTDISEYSLSGCLYDPDYNDAPKLSLDESFAGADGFGSGGQLPPVIDLRKYCSPVEDQQRSNSCVANAVVGALELLQNKSGHSDQDLSRLFLYFTARAMHGAQAQDQGTFVHLAMAALIASGICEERMWPFSMATINDPPTKACFENAQHYRGVEFAEIEPGTQLVPILAQEIPVIIGVELPREAYVEAHKTGTMNVPPDARGGTFQHGRHAMVVVGYDTGRKAYIVRNSWGEKFAEKGYFYMPFDLLDSSSMSRQMWAIGALNRAPGIKLLGATVEESVKGMVAAASNAAAPGRPSATDQLSQQVRGEIENRLEQARKGFSSRLRDK